MHIDILFHTLFVCTHHAMHIPTEAPSATLLSLPLQDYLPIENAHMWQHALHKTASDTKSISTAYSLGCLCAQKKCTCGAASFPAEAPSAEESSAMLSLSSAKQGQSLQASGSRTGKGKTVHKAAPYPKDEW